MTEAAKRLEAIGLNDPTIAALLKERKGNAMTKSDAELDEDTVDAAYETWIINRPEKTYPREAFYAGVEFGLRHVRAVAQSDPLPREHQDPSKWPTRETVERAHALVQSDTEPVAWQLVPKEPTAEMCDAGRAFFPENMDENDVYARPVWQAMLAAAPAQSDAEPDVTRAARLLGEYAQANGYDRFTWKMAVKTPGEEQERYRVEAVSEAALAQSDAEPVACAIANRSNELGLDVDGKVALHGICQEELERSDAEPVAWQTRRNGSPDWHICIGDPSMDSDSYEARPLYTAPPHPDEPTHRDMAYFGASEAAGYHYPGEDQQLLRDAYCRGAAEYAPRPDASEIEQLKAELHTTWQRRLENNRLAYQWMERHDKVCGYIAENYPSVMLPNLPFPPPVARPDASAELIEAEEALLWLAEEPIVGTEQERNDHLDKMPRHFVETIQKVRARAADRNTK